MEIRNHHSRKNFLATVAVLGAGISIHPGVSFAKTNAPHSLTENWKTFCEKFNGKSAEKTAVNQPLQACSGHTNRTGNHVIFKGEKIVAVPTWIYWKNNLSTPADLVVTFFDGSATGKKLARINRFEMEAMILQTEAGSQSTQHSLGKALEKKAQIRASVSKDQGLALALVNGKKQIMLRRKSINKI